MFEERMQRRINQQKTNWRHRMIWNVNILTYANSEEITTSSLICICIAAVRCRLCIHIRIQSLLLATGFSYLQLTIYFTFKYSQGNIFYRYMYPLNQYKLLTYVKQSFSHSVQAFRHLCHEADFIGLCMLHLG